MNESYDSEAPPEIRRYSGFWPLFSLLIVLVLWSGFQAIESYRRDAALEQQLNAAVRPVSNATEVKNKLFTLAKGLLDLSAKDPNAAQIVKEANIHVNNNSTSAPSTTPDSSSK